VFGHVGVRSGAGHIVEPGTRAFRQRFPHGKSRSVTHGGPRCDLVDRAHATEAQATRVIHLANADARRRDRLRALGHTVDVVAAYDEIVGHAGAIVHGADGLFEGGTDPRSDGAAIGW
jgi:gamma-glutamyltranspeptidase